MTETSLARKIGACLGKAGNQEVLSVSWRIPVLLAVIIATQFLEFSLIEAVIALYFVSALVWRVESDRTFLVALILLTITAILSFLREDGLAEGYAVYTYYFLVIGVITAIIELRGPVKSMSPSAKGKGPK